MSDIHLIIKDGVVDNVIVWDKENDPCNHGGDGAIKITDELIEYHGFTPKIGDIFTTVGTAYTVPPGAFISSDEG